MSSEAVRVRRLKLGETMTFGSPVIRAAGPDDADAVWAILGPVIRAGETYALPQDMTREDALAYWFSPGHEVFVADVDWKILEAQPYIRQKCDKLRGDYERNSSLRSA